MKSEIIAAMMADPKSTHMSKASAEAALETVFRAVEKVARDTGRARVPGFGTFTEKFRAEREVRNPRNGEKTRVAGKKVITFKQSKSAK